MERHGKESRNEELEFLRNCGENNLAGVRESLSRGVDVNTVCEDGHWSGLTIAAEENYPELLEILLSHPDIKINNTTECQMTALMFACRAGNSAIVSRLVEVPGLEINHQDESGHTAAHWTGMKGHTECVRILAETDRVDWNKRDVCGWTPLYCALRWGHSDIVDIIVQQPNIDYNVKTEDGETLGHAAVRGGNVQCVKSLTTQESFDCWNVPDRHGDTPIMMALKRDKTEIVEILLRCPRVDLSCRDREGWSLVFRAIQRTKIDVVKMILTKLKKPYSGSSLARIAVEVGEEEDIRLLVQSGSVDWNETAEDEDPAILWALKNEKFGIVDILIPGNKINLQGDPSTDLTINCDSETFRVHKYFLCSKSSVFQARLERWEREAEIDINTMNSDTLSSMIHYIYTGVLTKWEDLDIQDVTIAADMYDLPGWMQLFTLARNMMNIADLEDWD